VHYIDALRQFNVHRFRHLLKSLAGTDDATRLDDAMERVTVHSVGTVLNVLEVIEAVEFESVDVIVIDDVGLICTAAELSNSFHAHGAITRLGRTLKGKAKEHGVAVVTTSSPSYKTEHSCPNWLEAAPLPMCTKWIKCVDVNVRLMLTARFSTVSLLITKAHNHATNRQIPHLMLKIRQHIQQASY